MTKYCKHDSKGFSLIVTLLIVAILVLLASTWVVLFYNQKKIATSFQDSTHAKYIARVGTERAPFLLLDDVDWQNYQEALYKEAFHAGTYETELIPSLNRVLYVDPIPAPGNSGSGGQDVYIDDESTLAKSIGKKTNTRYVENKRYFRDNNMANNLLVVTRNMGYYVKKTNASEFHGVPAASSVTFLSGVRVVNLSKEVDTYIIAMRVFWRPVDTSLYIQKIMLNGTVYQGKWMDYETEGYGHSHSGAHPPSISNSERQDFHEHGDSHHHHPDHPSFTHSAIYEHHYHDTVGLNGALLDVRDVKILSGMDHNNGLKIHYLDLQIFFFNNIAGKELTLVFYMEDGSSKTIDLKDIPYDDKPIDLDKTNQGNKNDGTETQTPTENTDTETPVEETPPVEEEIPVEETPPVEEEPPVEEAPPEEDTSPGKGKGKKK